jgi:hypothetical protein
MTTIAGHSECSGPQCKAALSILADYRAGRVQSDRVLCVEMSSEPGGIGRIGARGLYTGDVLAVYVDSRPETTTAWPTGLWIPLPRDVQPDMSGHPFFHGRQQRWLDDYEQSGAAAT